MDTNTTTNHPLSLSPKSVPLHQGNIFLGSIAEIRRDRLGFLIEMARRYGDIAKFRIAHLSIYQVNHPDGIHQILQGNHLNYTKQAFGFNSIKLALGNGLVTSDGEFWLRQRRLVQPVFHRKYVTTFVDVMQQATTEMLDRWHTSFLEANIIDVAAEIQNLTLRIITQALFRSQVRDETRAIAEAIHILTQSISLRFDFPLYPPLFIPTVRNRRFKAALATVDQIVFSIIEQHRNSQADTQDLLSMMMAARDEQTGEGMSDKQLRDEVITLTNAGHGTVANALTWTLYLLSLHPEILRKLRDQVDRGLSGRTPTAEDLPSLSYTRWVIEEAMRLYPPVWITVRRALRDDEVCDFHVPANAIVVVSPYVLHHDHRYWLNPEGFDPDRFSPEQSGKRPRYAYFPFGGGPHLCLGKDFALLEAQLILIMLIQRYRLDLLPGSNIEAEALAGLRPRKGLPMTMHPW